MSRRVVHRDAGRYQLQIFVRPPAVNLWSDFEERALAMGYTAVIDGVVVEPGTPEADRWMRVLSEKCSLFSDATQAAIAHRAAQAAAKGEHDAAD